VAVGGNEIKGSGGRIMTIISARITTITISLAVALIIYGFGIMPDAKAQTQRTEGKVHEKSLSVTTIGSGIPGGSFNNRSEAMTVIQNKGKYIVLDCGYGSLLKLAKFNYLVKNIDIIMFTHLHADHSTDFLSLMISRWASGGRGLELIGPPKTESYYNFFKSFYRDDVIYRAMLGAGNTTGALNGVNVREITGNKKFTIGDVSIESAEMVHTMYDLAYKFVINGTTIVVTGDTSYNETLVNFAKNADMLVLDGSFIIYALKPPVNSNFDLATFLAKKVDGKTYQPEAYSGNFGVESHSKYEDIIKIGVQTAPKKLLLTHLYGSSAGKPDPQTDELKNKVISDLKKAGFTGEVFFAEDGLEIGLK
jgi:ribonuclease BN (tRNA processing enzyme)